MIPDGLSFPSLASCSIYRREKSKLDDSKRYCQLIKSNLPLSLIISILNQCCLIFKYFFCHFKFLSHSPFITQTRWPRGLIINLKLQSEDNLEIHPNHLQRQGRLKQFMHTIEGGRGKGRMGGLFQASARYKPCRVAH